MSGTKSALRQPSHAGAHAADSTQQPPARRRSVRFADEHDEEHSDSEQVTQPLDDDTEIIQSLQRTTAIAATVLAPHTNDAGANDTTAAEHHPHASHSTRPHPLRSYSEPVRSTASTHPRIDDTPEGTVQASAATRSKSMPARWTEAHHAAATRLQAAFRGARERLHRRKELLYEAFNALDWKEESELMDTHSSYEQLKQDVSAATAEISPSLTDEPTVELKEEKASDSSSSAVSSMDTESDQVSDAEMAVVPLRHSPRKRKYETDTSSEQSPVHKRKTDVALESAAAEHELALESKELLSSLEKESAVASAKLSTPTKHKRAGKVSSPTKPNHNQLTAKQNYLQLHEGDNITLDFVESLTDLFKSNEILNVHTVTALLRRVRELLKPLPNIVEISVPTRLTVCGDLHGQLDDLLHIFKINGQPSERNHYLFNGDFVDRGQYSCECILTLFAYKLLYPSSFFLNRGNHECRDINSRDGFEREVLLKYNKATFDLFSDTFAHLPLATILEQQVFVVHGGLMSTFPSMAQLQSINRVVQATTHKTEQEQWMEELLWSDPDVKKGIHPSPRGAGVQFGADITNKFLQTTNLKMIVRSHEVFAKGHRSHHDGKVHTVFSASNYCGTFGNEGAIMILEKSTVTGLLNHKIVNFMANAKETQTQSRLHLHLLTDDVISRLLQRISDARLALQCHWDAIAKQDKNSNIRSITRLQWQEGLKQVLKIQLPFLQYSEYLGLPTVGVDGKKNGSIDYW